ncbi:MAG: ATP-binding protein, partial [Halobacteriaceae archaeon]
MRVLGARDPDGARCRLGASLARDGSPGGTVGLDLERPHAAVVVGKRGSGKSHTLGVLGEGLAATAGVGGVIIDPMGGLSGLAVADGVRRITEPVVAPTALPARSWCQLLDLDPAGAVGGLVWRAARLEESLAAMAAHVQASPAAGPARRAAIDHLRLADSWGVFDREGLRGADFQTGEVTVLDLAGTGAEPVAAIVRAVADGLYTAGTGSGDGPLPWLVVDEAHAVIGGPAQPALDRLLTRGRHPGISVVLATQRPAVLPRTAVSQADLIIAHRLTATSDVDALAGAQGAYHHESIAARLPDEQGHALVVDDATEAVHTVRVRERQTPHG